MTKAWKKLYMSGYIGDAVEEFPKDVSTPVSSPAYDHLFKTIKGGLLSDEQEILFHRLVEKLLFVSKRVALTFNLPLPSSPHVCVRLTKTTGKRSADCYST